MATSLSLKRLKSRANTKSNGPHVFAVIGDEPYFLQHFIPHYRSLGFESFCLYLDRPTQETLRQANSIPEAEIFTSDFPYGKVFGKHSNGALLRWHHILKDTFTEQYFRNQWVLTVDADEFAVLPARFKDIRALCAELDDHNIMHVSAPMVDFYPESLRYRNFDQEKNPFEACCWFDAGPYYRWEQQSVTPLPLYSGVRERITRHLALSFREDWQRIIGPDYAYKPPKMWKVPLVKHGNGVERIMIHEANITPTSEINIALCHFKYYPGIDEKISQAIERSEYYRGALEYRIIDLAIRKMSDFGLVSETRSRIWEGSASLEKAKLLVDSLQKPQAC